MALDRNTELIADLPRQAAPERTDIPARLRTAEQRRVELRAVCLDDLVPEKHRVRLVWEFADALDLAPLYAAIKAVEGRPGHPPADPRIL